MTRFYFILAIYLSLTSLYSQPELPENGEVFVDNLVPRVDILVDPDTLDWIYENVESYTEFHSTFIFNNGNIIDTIENTGFRLRGNTSRYASKKSFKISFNTFDPGRKWYGLEKLNLNGEHNDPSVIRSKLGWDLLYDLEIPAPRSNHVEVYINGDYYGLYINVEHIDEEFVKSRFGNNDGNLFKCLYPADLDYLGSDPNNYKYEIYGRRPYDLKTNTALDDYSDIAHFIDVLNNTPDAQFLCELEKVFNIYDYLKIIAADIFTGNWDGYIYNKNNFYLYNNTETGRFEYIPYDVDNTYGIDWIGKDWGTRDIYDWEQHGDNVRPLYTRIIENQELKDQFTFYLNQLLQEITNPVFYFTKIDEIRDMIDQYIINDSYYSMDYGWSYDNFLDSYIEPLGGHVPYGLKPYVTTRSESSYDQMENNNIVPVIKYFDRNSPVVGENLWISAYVEDDNEVDAKIIYTINSGSPQVTYMYDDGNHHDGEANDKIYGGVIPDLAANTMIEYQISGEDEYGNENIMPCDPFIIELIESEEPALFINEFMASNETTIADEYGEYDDWIEVYNGDQETVWLGDKYLTDNLGNPDKWLMPDVWLPSGDFVLFWADNDPDQGPYHTNFRLDMDGEEIGVFDAESTGFFPLDTITYGPQTTDISYGRNPDAGISWIYFTDPTPGASNVTGATNVVDFISKGIIAYPNPALAGSEIYFNKEIDFRLINSAGELIYIRENTIKLNTQSLVPGLYILMANDGANIKLIIE